MSIPSFTVLKSHLESLPLNSPVQIGFTGGGAVKYRRELQELFPQARFFDEIESIARGGIYSGMKGDEEEYILAHIGTGISFIQIDPNQSKYQRIGGTNVGGSVLTGICQRNGISIEEGLKAAAERGNHQRVDTLVKDIYGQDYGAIGLVGDLVAGSLGKLSGDSSVADMVSGILFLIASNLCHLLVLYAAKYSSTNIKFSGSLSDNYPFQQSIKECMQFYDQSQKLSISFHPQPGYIACQGVIHQLRH